MKRTLIAIAFLVGLPSASAAPRLKHSVSHCARALKPTPAERKVIERLKTKTCDADCVKALRSELIPPVRRCYNPRNPPETWERCARLQRRRPFITATGTAGAIEIRQRLKTYCSARKHLRLSLQRKDSKLTLVERYDGESVTKCVCAFDIQSTITDLAPGEYSLEVVYDNRYAKTRSVLERFEALKVCAGD